MAWPDLNFLATFEVDLCWSPYLVPQHARRNKYHPYVFMILYAYCLNILGLNLIHT